MNMTSQCGEAALSREHQKMIQQLRFYGIKDPNVLRVMEQIPRHRFIPNLNNDQKKAFGDHPVKIGFGQTISQPYIVAYMTELLKLQKGERVLEIGTGCGYQTAVLAALEAIVYSVELIPELSQFASEVLEKEGYEDVFLNVGDGYEGWIEHSPYEAIIVTCAPESVPQALVGQLAKNGRLLLPLGGDQQRLVLMCKHGDEITEQIELPVRFVPMVHRD